jgi:sugar lactone lactonase YvrE
VRTHKLVQYSSDHQFLEALRWHDGALWASDFFSKEVLRFSSDGTSTTVAVIDGAPSGLGFLPDGSVLVVSQAGATVQRIADDGSVSTYADFSSIAGGAGNDLLVTAAGHAYAGNFGFTPGVDDPKPTHLAHVDPDGHAHDVDADLVFPNGMAVTADGVLLVAETFLHRISAFDINPDGSLSGLRVWAQLDDSYHPDGIALDSDGGVWFGNALTTGDDSGFYRVVEGGEITDKVPVTGAWAVACAFGGDGLGTLFMSCNATTVEDFNQGRSTATIAVANVQRSGAPSSSTHSATVAD